jgi:hypothetical protein
VPEQPALFLHWFTLPSIKQNVSSVKSMLPATVQLDDFWQQNNKNVTAFFC